MRNFCMEFFVYLVTASLATCPALASNTSFQDIGSERAARERLYSDMESSKIFQNKLVPLSQAGPVKVDFSILIYKVIEILESRQTMTSAAYFTMRWRDDHLSWNPADYANISCAYFPSDRVWYPKATVFNSAVEDFEFFSVPDYIDVFSDGEFIIVAGTLVHTHCHFDLKYFPFDTQTCAIMVGVEGNDVEISLNVTKGHLLAAISEHITIPAEWTVTGHLLEVSGSDNIQMVVYKVELTRAYLYYALCVLGPMAGTSQLTLLVFWIPATSGERISFLMSIYVSATLYLGLVGDILPRKTYTFANAPRMVLFVIYSVIQCALVLVATIVSMHKHQAEQDFLFDMRIQESGKAKVDSGTEAEPKGNNFPSRSLQETHPRPSEDSEQTPAGNAMETYLEDSTENRNTDDVTKRERISAPLVGIACWKRRFLTRVSRFVAKHKTDRTNKPDKRKKETRKKPSCISAYVLDKLFFCFFVSTSSLFYFSIFKV